MPRSMRTWKIACASRILTVSLAFLFGCMFRNHVPTTSTEQLVCGREDTEDGTNGMLQRILEGFAQWDTQHFLYIAQCGYTHEQNHAFFPFLPGLLHLSIQITPASVHAWLGSQATAMLWGLVLCNSAFVGSAVFFYRLTKHVLANEQLVRCATLLYCFNPASIFCSAVYTESLYALFFFAGLFQLYVKDRWWLAAILFFHCTAIRSNGILCAGYFWYTVLIEVQPTQRSLSTRILSGATRVIACTMACFLPFLAFEAFGYHQQCVGVDPLPNWCASRIPLLYGYVQKTYWENGLLAFWQLKQIPNFILAGPILFFSFYISWRCISKRWRHFWRALLSFRNHEMTVKGWSATGLYGRISFCMTVHLAFLSGFCLLFMNVQVATRFLAASPPLYWFAAHMSQQSCRIRKIIWGYLYTYIALGSLLFTNAYPWT
uniref:GPI mannosyltransferase 2 n=1 Tax=Picocystis salinarum TaxID=88271 RepID=A0A7S3XC92_9CHLO